MKHRGSCLDVTRESVIRQFSRDTLAEFGEGKERERIGNRKERVSKRKSSKDKEEMKGVRWRGEEKYM